MMKPLLFGIRVGCACWKRNLLSAGLLSHLIRWGMGVVSAAILYWVSHLLEGSRFTQSPHLSMPYFMYALIGLVFLQFLSGGFFAATTQFFNEYVSGSLENLWIAAHPMSRTLVLSVLVELWSAAVGALCMLAAANLLFGARFDPIQIAGIVGIGGLVAAGTACLGLLLSASAIILRRSQLTRVPVLQAMAVLSGMLFPVAMLPRWAQAASGWLPATHGLRLARALTADPSGPVLWDAWGKLLATTAVFIVFSLAALQATLRFGRVHGGIKA